MNEFAQLFMTDADYFVGTLLGFGFGVLIAVLLTVFIKELRR